MSIQDRINRLERAQPPTAAEGCCTCVTDQVTPRHVDYREAIAPMTPDYEPLGDGHQLCGECGRPRLIQIVPINYSGEPDPFEVVYEDVQVGNDGL